MSVTEYFDSCLQQADGEEQKYEVEKSRAIALAYSSVYAHDPYKSVAIEEPFELPLYDPYTSEEMPDTTYCGVFDALLEKDGDLYLGDHKTASDASYLYWESQKLESQITHYWMACMQMGLDIKGFLWDVIVKPRLKPSQVTKKALDELMKSGTYCEVPYPHSDWEQLSAKDKETPRMYGHRYWVTMMKNPQDYFIRRVLQRDRKAVLLYLEETVRIVENMYKAMADRSYGYRNTDNCCAFNRMCQFHPICSGVDSTGSKFQIRQDQQERIQWHNKTGIRLSPSSRKMFMGCPAKWLMAKHDNLEPIKLEYQAALAIGTMVHHALEHYHLKQRPSTLQVTLEGNLATKLPGE